MHAEQTYFISGWHLKHTFAFVFFCLNKKVTQYNNRNFSISVLSFFVGAISETVKKESKKNSTQ